jgi:hypothetical protein
MNAIADFKDRTQAAQCYRYAALRYSKARLKLRVTEGGKFPYAMAIDLESPDAQLAIAFIKGFAYALGDRTLVMEVMCRGDERERYDRPEGVPLMQILASLPPGPRPKV